MASTPSPTPQDQNEPPPTSKAEYSAVVSVSAIPPPAYSTFPPKQITLIIFLASFAGTFSPLSSFIFFPAIDDLARALDVSVGKVNLTVTSYMIVSGLAPAILGDLADNIGRRMVYLAMMAVYCSANIGLAFQKNWTALFLLRMLQSAGSAGTWLGPSDGYYCWKSCSRSRVLTAVQLPSRWGTVSSRTLLRHLSVEDSSLRSSLGKQTHIPCN